MFLGIFHYFILFLKNIYLFIYFWLCWVFVSVRGLSLVAASGGHSSSRWAGLSLSRPLLLRSTGSRRTGSVIVAHGPSCSVACGIFPDQGSNPCPLHWQADSQPLRHQGSPEYNSFKGKWTVLQRSFYLFNLDECDSTALGSVLRLFRKRRKGIFEKKGHKYLLNCLWTQLKKDCVYIYHTSIQKGLNRF